MKGGYEMEAKELRIGNLIYQKDEIVKVNYLTICSIGYGNGNFAPSNSKLAFFKPIPITEEILMECEFKYDYFYCPDFGHYIKIYHFDGIYIGLIDEKFWLFDEYKSNVVKKRKLNGLHEVQNLIFDFTGEELDVSALFN